MRKMLARLSRSFLAGFVSLLLVAPQALAGKSHGKGSNEQREIDRAVAVMGDHFEELDRCLDVVDTDVCFAELLESAGASPEVIPLAFLIGAIIKFKSHRDCDTVCERLEAFLICLRETMDPNQCTLMTDARLERLADLLILYRELRPYCEDTGNICPQPNGWPSDWPWPFKTRSGGRR